MSKLVRYVQLKPSPAHVMANLPWTGRKRPYLLIIYSDNTTKTITVRNVNLREDPKLALHIAEKLKRQIEIEAAEFRFDIKKYSMRTESITVEQLFGEYLSYVKKQVEAGNLASGTLNTYTSYLNLIAETMGRERVTDVTAEMIEDYLDKMVASTTTRNESYSGYSLNTQLAIGKAAFSFAQKRQYVADNPFKHVAQVKAKKPFKFMNEYEVAAMREGLAATNRIWAVDLFDVGIATGLRISGLLDMNFKDYQQIDVDGSNEHFFNVTEKGDKPRFVPVHSCISILERRRSMIGDKAAIIEHIADSRHLFIDECYGRASAGYVFFEISNQTTVNQVFRQVRREKKLSENITPHSMRHTFAVRYLEDGGDIYALSQILGHSDLSSTQIYLTATPKLLRLRRKI